MRTILDKWGRNIDYLKISINNRVNLNSIYCIPKEDISYTKEDEFLTTDEMVKIAKISSNLGITKIGIVVEGVVLVEGIQDLIYRIKNIEGIKEVLIDKSGSSFDHSNCKDCNRIRITADGVVKQCLFFNSPVNIKKLIREGIYDEDLEKILKDLIYNKPYNKPCE